MASTFVARAYLKTDDPKHSHLVGTVPLDSSRRYTSDADFDYAVSEVEKKFSDWDSLQIVEIQEAIREILTKD